MIYDGECIICGTSGKNDNTVGKYKMRDGEYVEMCDECYKWIKES